MVIFIPIAEGIRFYQLDTNPKTGYYYRLKGKILLSLSHYSDRPRIKEQADATRKALLDYGIHCEVDVWYNTDLDNYRARIQPDTEDDLHMLLMQYGQ